jgi:hypothetical protein
MKKDKGKGEAIPLIKEFIDENPLSSLWTLFVIIDYFTHAIRPIKCFPSLTIKLVWLFSFVLLTIGISILGKKYLFTYKQGKNNYGIEDLSEWVDDSPIGYFFICLALSSGFEYLFGNILKGIALSCI